MPYLADVAIFGLVCVLLFWSSLRAITDSRDKEYPILDLILVYSSFLLGLVTFALWIGCQARDVRGFISVSPLLFYFFWLLLLNGRRRQEYEEVFSRVSFSFKALRVIDRLLFLYLAVVFLFTFLLTLAPPNATDWDSLMYHLAAPAQYLRAGKIVELPYDHHTYFPFTMEMLFLWGMAIKGPVLAKLFHWLMLPLCCGALIAIGKRHFSLRTGLFAAALFASIPLVQAEASTAYIDLGLAAFTLLAYLCFLNWKTTGENSWLLWCGAFCGFCMGTKYLGALTFGWIGLWAVILMMKDALPRPLPLGGELSSSTSEGKVPSFSPPSGRGRGRVKPLLTFVTLALLLGGGWYVRNWVQTGNPVYPFGYSIFGGSNWNQQMADQYEADQRAYGFGRSPVDLIMLPWRASVAPFNTGLQRVNANQSGENGVVIDRFAGMPWWPFVNLQVSQPQNGLFDTQGMVASLALRTMLGPAFLAFGLPLLFVRRKPWVVNFLLYSFLFYGLFWFLTGQYLRYLVPAFALLCLPCGWMIEKCLSRSKILKYSTGFCLTLWLLVTPVLTLKDGLGALDVTLGFVTPQEYLSRSFAPYDAMRRASSETPEKARFAVYGEPRTLYLERDYFWADDPHNNLIDYAQIKTGADFIKALKARGATHIFWNTQPAFGGPPPQMQQAIEESLVELLFEEKACRVYGIR